MYGVADAGMVEVENAGTENAPPTPMGAVVVIPSMVTLTDSVVGGCNEPEPITPDNATEAAP